MKAASTVFVYGTLKRGFYNNKIIHQGASRFIQNAQTLDSFPMVIGEYCVPYLLPMMNGREGHRIRGELWAVSVFL